MDNEQYCVDLNLNNLSALRDDIDWKTYTDQFQKIVPKRDINPKVIDLLEGMGLTICHLECFYTNPPKEKYDFNKLHIDNPGGGDYIKLNWIYGGKDSLMVWGKPKDKVNIKPIEISPAGTRYREYLIPELDIVLMRKVGFPSIVQVGIPHTAFNFVEPRLCVCVAPSRNGKQLTMSEAVETFKSFIV